MRGWGWFWETAGASGHAGAEVDLACWGGGVDFPGGFRGAGLFGVADYTLPENGFGRWWCWRKNAWWAELVLEMARWRGLWYRRDGLTRRLGDGWFNAWWHRLGGIVWTWHDGRVILQ